VAYIKCEKCGEYNYLPCKCTPFAVYYPDYFGEEKEQIYGNSFEEVVERIAKMINEDEPIFEGNLFNEPIEITDENGTTKKFNCTASVSVDYFPEEIEYKEAEE